MIDVKQAVKKAMGYLREMYNVAEFKDVLLEEVDLSDDNQYWNVTIGFTRGQESTSEGPMASLVGPSAYFKREYKIFKIEANTGIVRSMKIRKSE